MRRTLIVIFSLVGLLFSSGDVDAATDLNHPDAQATPRSDTKALILTGTISTFLGLEGEFVLQAAANGAYRFEVNSEAPHSEVFDGDTLWEKDWHGAVRAMAFAEREGSLLQIAIMRGDWASENGPLVLVDEPELGGVTRFRIRDGLLEGTITFDDKNQPLQVQSDNFGAGFTFEFSEYQYDPLALPTRIVITDPQGNITELRVRSVETGVTLSSSAFARPVPDESRVSWSSDAATRIETRLASSGHHLVRATVNGQDFGWFIFDSGAGGSVLTPRAIKAMGLKEVGSVQVGGIGGSVQSDIVLADRVTIGSMTLHAPRFVSLDLSFMDSVAGVRIAGILGYDILARAVVRVHPREAFIEIHKPGVEPRADWVECLVPSRVPVVSAGVEGNPGQYRLDTGAARATVDFHSPAVKRLKLLAGRNTRSASANGVGGRIPTRAGEVASFTLAGKAWKDLPVEFSLSGVGSLADPYLDGNIGGRILNSFELWFDYPNQRIGFVPHNRGD